MVGTVSHRPFASTRNERAAWNRSDAFAIAIQITSQPTPSASTLINHYCFHCVGNGPINMSVKPGNVNMPINRVGRESDPIERPVEDREMRVRLEIERGGPCRLDRIEGDVIGIDVRLSDEACNVDAVVRDPAADDVSTQYFENLLCKHCPGKVFKEHGCLPRYREINEGSFVVETYVADTEAVADLVADIRSICANVSLRSIVSTDRSEFKEDCSVDLSALTTKQRKAVYHAKEMGYYDPDSDVALGELAERIGISTSALSQRLRRAEGNVLRQLSVECSCWDDVGCARPDEE